MAEQKTEGDNSNESEAFYKLVVAMRAAQREYFQTRSTESLRTSKELERQVDQTIAKHKARQGELF